MESVIPSEVADSAGPVALFGFATPKPGREDELERTLRSFVQPTRAEEGAIVYEIHSDPRRPGVIAFYEHWASGEHLRRHLELPQMQTFLAHRGELLDGDLDIQFFRPLLAR